MKKKWIIIALLLIGTALLGASYLLGSTPAAKLERAIVKANQAAADGAALDLTEAKASLSGLDTQETVAAMTKAADRLRKNEQSAVTVAVLAAETLPAAEARTVITALLAAEPVSSAWLPAQVSALPTLLSPLTEEDIIAVLTAADVAEDDMNLQNTLGDLSGDLLTPGQVADIHAARQTQGLPAERMLMRGLGRFTEEEIMSVLSTEKDEPRRLIIAQGYGRSLMTLEDVLIYLADARALGLSATDCYPEGAVVRGTYAGLSPLGLPTGQVGGARPTLSCTARRMRKRLNPGRCPWALRPIRWTTKALSPPGTRATTAGAWTPTPWCWTPL